MKKNDSFEEEILYDDSTNSEEDVSQPFDPKQVDIVSETMVVANIIERLKSDGIVLNPNFQRNPELWDDQRQSRLIESLIIRIPLPTFYFDYDDENDHYIVVDGQQRLWAIKRFASLDRDSENRLRLRGLEYLPEFEGKLFEELPTIIQRRIREQTFNTYVIRPGTPENIRNSIFTRINTGGMQLTPAEIKNSVYRGQAADLLRELAHSQEFVRATNGKVDETRMADCELVNRFLAFFVLGTEKYGGNLEQYLNDVLLTLKRSTKRELNEYRIAFLKSMTLSYEIFGVNAFKRITKNKKYGRINKPLFECVSVCMARLTDTERKSLVQKKESFLQQYTDLIQEKWFVNAITDGTAKKSSVEKRYTEIDRIIKATICPNGCLSNNS